MTSPAVSLGGAGARHPHRGWTRCPLPSGPLHAVRYPDIFALPCLAHSETAHIARESAGFISPASVPNRDSREASPRPASPQPEQSARISLSCVPGIFWPEDAPFLGPARPGRQRAPGQSQFLLRTVSHGSSRPSQAPAVVDHGRSSRLESTVRSSVASYLPSTPVRGR
jgi:hypothetical protein